MDASYWDKKRPKGVHDDIDLTQHQSLIEMLDTAVETFADRPAFTSINYTITYRQLNEYAMQFATYLRQHTNLKPGDRIAIQLPNILQYPIVVLAAMRVGLVIVNTNPLYTEREMLHQFNDSGATLLVCMNTFAKSVENIMARTALKQVIVTELADLLPFPKRLFLNVLVKYAKKIPNYHFSKEKCVSFNRVLEIGRACKTQYKRHQAIASDIALLQYTGGTTGLSKGAILTQANLLANYAQAFSLQQQQDEKGNKIKPESSVSCVMPLPLYHIYAFTCMLSLISSGDHGILIADPRNTSMFIRMIKPWKPFMFLGVNTLFESLLNHPKFKRCDFSQLHLTVSGGTGLHEDIYYKWKAATGCAISEGYGLTECSPLVAVNGGMGTERVGTVGLPVPSTSVKCIDEQEKEVAMGEKGELCVKGPQVMRGYWNDVQETEKAFTKDGKWLRTGDVAIIDKDGFIRIVDRIKDMILVSGFNVYPFEIETVVAKHPRVDQCAAVGVSHKKTGEAVVLFVVLNKDVLVPEALAVKKELIAYCRKSLVPYKIPSRIEIRDELPMTPVGKILRRELQQQVQRCESIEK